MVHNREKGILKEKVEKNSRNGSEVKKKWLREEYICIALGFVMLFGCIISFKIPIELMKILASVGVFLSIGRILLGMLSALYWVNVDEDELALLDEILEKDLDEEDLDEEDKNTLLDKFKIDK